MNLTNVSKINGIAIENIAKINGKLKAEIQGGGSTQVATPIFDPVDNTESLTGELTVTITCATEGATIYYEKTVGVGGPSSDPDDPTIGSTVYSDPEIITGFLPPALYKFKAFAVKDGMTDSEITSIIHYTVGGSI